MKKIIAIVMSLTLMFAVVSGCSSTSGKLASIEKNGKAVMYTNANFPPYEYMEGTTIMGVDVDIAKEIAKDLGVTLDIQNADFDGIVASIASGKGDMALSGMTITDKRKESVDFSKPYTKSVQYLILPKDSAIATMEDLAGKKVGSPLGYTGEIVIEEEQEKGVLKDKGTELKTYKSAVDASLDIGTGRLDAVIMDELVAQKIAADNTTLKAIPVVYANGDKVEEEYGVAVAKGNEDLLVKINATIDRLIASGSINSYILTHGSKSIETVK